MNRAEGKPRSGRRLRVWLLVVPVLAWWVFLWGDLDDSILTRVPIMDEATYLQQGDAIASGQWLPNEPFFMSPLYPYLVALSGGGRALGEDQVRTGSAPRSLWLVQALVWALVIVLLYQAARRHLPGSLAFLPPLLFALYRPGAIFATTALLEIWLTLAVTALLVLLDSTAARRGRATAALGAGLLAGVATLLRAHTVLLLIPAALVLGRRAGGLLRLTVMGAAWGILVAPVILFNSFSAGQLTSVTTNGGLNFYIGQGPQANGFFTSFNDFSLDVDPAGVEFLSRRLNRPLKNSAEADRIWTREAWAAVTDNPGRAVRLWLKKIWLHFVGWEIDQVTPLAAWSRDGPALRLLVVPYTLIAVLGLAGLAMVLWRDRRWSLWALALLVLVGSQSFFFLVSRYRLAIVPLLCLLAAAGLGVLIKLRGRSLLWAGGVLVSAALIAQPWGLAEVRAHWSALGLCNEAVRWELLGDAQGLAQAAELCEQARRAEPSLIQAHRGLARVRQKQDQGGAAEQVLAAGILQVSNPASLMRDLIALQLERGDLTAALPRMAAYLRDQPEDPDMLHNYSVALSRTGRTEAAVAAARRLLSTAPADPRGYVDLGILLARQGRRQEAREVFSQGLQQAPHHEGLRHNLKLLSEE